MTQSQSPSLDDWKELYDAAIRFKKIESWKWMWDSDIFGVQNPSTGEIGYCCVMGALGEVFALAVYLGTAGLEGYLKMQSGKILEMDALHIQDCLMASFEDRNYLEKGDLQIIKQLGLKFRGRNAWPQFRRYEPGYFPWYLDKGEAQYLTVALEQAVEVALRVKDNSDLLVPEKENRYLVRVPKKEKNKLKWMDKWLQPEPLKKAEPITNPPDELRLQKIKKMAARQQGVWEVDFFYAPAPAKEEGKPFYPFIFMYVDKHSGMIFHTHMAKPMEYRSEFQEQFLHAIERLGFSPKEILLQKKEVLTLLEPIVTSLGIKTKLVNKLTSLEAARSAMFQFFR